MTPSEAARVEEIRRFHEQWHAKQTVSSQSTCEGCFLLDAVARAVKDTKADAIALCAAEFERGKLSGRSEQAEENARLRAAYDKVRGWAEHLNECDPFFGDKERPTFREDMDALDAALAPAPEPTP